MKARLFTAGIAIAAALTVQPMVASASQGDILIRGGVGYVAPDSNNLKNVLPGANLDVKDGVSATIEAVYMLTDNFGVELLAAWPFSHDVRIDGLGTVAEVEHLPPTLSLQYYFLPDAQLRPYVGIGLNYTFFTREKEKGALRDGFRVELDDSWGVAFQVGLDFGIADDWFGNVGIRYIDIESDLKLNGTKLGTVKIDPWVYQLQVGYRFSR